MQPSAGVWARYRTNAKRNSCRMPRIRSSIVGTRTWCCTIRFSDYRSIRVIFVATQPQDWDFSANSHYHFSKVDTPNWYFACFAELWLPQGQAYFLWPAIMSVSYKKCLAVCNDCGEIGRYSATTTALKLYLISGYAPGYVAHTVILYDLPCQDSHDNTSAERKIVYIHHMWPTVHAENRP